MAHIHRDPAHTQTLTRRLSSAQEGCNCCGRSLSGGSGWAEHPHIATRDARGLEEEIAAIVDGILTPAPRRSRSEQR
jgi:hypothetical protein